MSKAVKTLERNLSFGEDLSTKLNALEKAMNISHPGFGFSHGKRFQPYYNNRNRVYCVVASGESILLNNIYQINTESKFP